MEKDSRNSEIEKQLLKLLAREIEKQLNKGPVSEWSQRDFVGLSETIEAQTKEQISVTTLKRVFGKVEYNGLPYIHTLNVLAQFTGHLHWSAFKKKELGIEDEDIEIPKPQQNRNNELIKNSQVKRGNEFITSKTKHWIKGFVLMVGLGLFFGLGWYGSWWWWKGRWLVPETKNNIDSPGKLSTEILNQDTIPVVVKFNYQGPVSDPDELTVISLEPGKMEHFAINGAGYGKSLHTYTEPGIYPVRIFCNRRQLAYYPFLVSDKKWAAKISQGRKSIKIKLDLSQQPFLKFNNESISQVGIDTNARFMINLIKFKDYGLSGDSFTFISPIRNNQIKPELKDQLSKIILRCANNSIHIQMAKIRPRYGFFMQISDNYLNKENQKDQKRFIHSMENWRVVKIQTKGKLCKVWIDDNLVLQKPYSLPLGDVMGVEYFFSGNGEVKSFQMHDQRGKIWDEVF